MPKMTVMPEGKEYGFASGKNLMEIMLDTGLFIDNACGGNGLCGKCRVRITEVTPEKPERPNAGSLRLRNLDKV